MAPVPMIATRMEESVAADARGCTPIKLFFLSACICVYPRLGFFDVSMRFLDAETGGVQALANFVCDQHAAVLTARAAEGNRQIALSLPDVMRQKIDQKIRDALDEFHRLREGTNVAGDARMLAAQVLKGGDVVRVRKEANVKDEIAVGGNA